MDKMFFTKEERADANQKLSDWYLQYLAATAPQNVARRMIAMVIVWTWWLLVVLGVVVKGVEVAVYKLHVAQAGEQLYSEFIFDVLANVVMNPFLTVMGFYFLAHVVRTYNNGKEKE